MIEDVKIIDNNRIEYKGEVLNVPHHIAVIPDGNRRWARERGLAPIFGHKEGVETYKKLLENAADLGVSYVTFYAFSTENWKRSEEEVTGLMLLLQSYLDDYSKRADTENIRVRFIGKIAELSENVQKSINKCIERTKENTGVTFNIALNYGGRDEITTAVKNIVQDVKNGNLNIEEIDEKLISTKLYTNNMPDPDLIIRTSGELRLSGFLTWQSTYSELYFIEKYWPDFNENDLDEAIKEYQRRNRKFGAN